MMCTLLSMNAYPNNVKECFYMQPESLHMWCTVTHNYCPKCRSVWTRIVAVLCPDVNISIGGILAGLLFTNHVGYIEMKSCLKVETAHWEAVETLKTAAETTWHRLSFHFSRAPPPTSQPWNISSVILYHILQNERNCENIFCPLIFTRLHRSTVVDTLPLCCKSSLDCPGRSTWWQTDS